MPFYLLVIAACGVVGWVGYHVAFVHPDPAHPTESVVLGVLCMALAGWLTYRMVWRILRKK